MNTPKTIADDPQFKDRFAWLPADRLGADQLGSPIKYLDSPVPEPTKAPTVGEHSEAVLSEVLGYSPERIAELRESGVIG